MMNSRSETEIAVLREIAAVMARERNVRSLLETAIDIFERRLGMLRGTFTLLDGDELRIAASASELNAEGRSLGRYRIGEGVTGLVAKTGKAEVVSDIRKSHRFLNRTRSRGADEALSFVCVPLFHRGQVIGTLSADRKMTGHAAELERDVELLEIIANLVAEAAAVCREEDAEREALMNENRMLRGIVNETPGRLIGNCREMRAVYEQIRQVAASEATVLIRGESGTGKELVAQALQSLSPRKDRPFVVLNCAALPEALVESELFGHEKGAFTDARERRIGRAEAADGGTLFLDEIGDLSIPVQVKLLRFLQERTFSRVGSNEQLRSDVRFIAATSRDLEGLMARKLFREDLYYRLSVFPIRLPRLADRGDDVVLLARHFLDRLGAKYGKRVTRFSVPAINAMKAYAWPGNVRELENCVERAVLTAKDDCIRSYNLPETMQHEEFAEGDGGEGALPLDAQLAAFERRVLEDAIRRHDGSHGAAAKELGISERTMSYRLARTGSELHRARR